MMTTGLKGTSSMKLHRGLGITQKTAWYLMQRIREEFFGDPTVMPGPVEVDENYMGGKRKNMPKAKRAQMEGRGAVGKTAVVGIKDRQTKRVAPKVVPNPKGKTLLKFVKFVRETVVPESEVYTDDSPAYIGLKEYSHDSVNHSAQE